MIFLTRSLLLLFPTYTISKGMRAACATVFAVVVNFLIHSMSSPPYKKTYLSSLIQFRTAGSMPSTSSSSRQVSSLQRTSSFTLVKGKARLPQIHIMWIAFGLTTLPWGSNTTRMGLFLNCHTSPMNLVTALEINVGWCTMCHGIIDSRYSNRFCIESFHLIEWSTIGIQTTSNWLSTRIPWALDSL